MDDFIPSEFLKRTFRWWWLLVVLMIIGGIAGILMANLQKPVYESQASITTSIDFAYADRLDDHDEDYLISTVGDVIESSQVFEMVKQRAASMDISISDEDIKTRFTKARQGYRWEVTVRDSNPVVAQKLTQIWVESAGDALGELRESSIDSLIYHTAELALQNCFSQMVVIEPSSAYCSIENLDEIRAALDVSSSLNVSDSLPNALLLSKISTEVTDDAYLPGAPIVFKRNLMVLTGCICGLLAGLGILLFGKLK